MYDSEFVIIIVFEIYPNDWEHFLMHTDYWHSLQAMILSIKNKKNVGKGRAVAMEDDVSCNDGGVTTRGSKVNSPNVEA